MRIEIMSPSNAGSDSNSDIRIEDICITDYTVSDHTYMVVLTYQEERYIVTTHILKADSILEAFRKEYWGHMKRKAIIDELNRDLLFLLPISPTLKEKSVEL